MFHNSNLHIEGQILKIDFLIINNLRKVLEQKN